MEVHERDARVLILPGAGPHFSQDGEVIAQGFGFTGNYLDEWNNSVYCQVQIIPCRFKEQARIRYSCEKWGPGLGQIFVIQLIILGSIL